MSCKVGVMQVGVSVGVVIQMSCRWGVAVNVSVGVAIQMFCRWVWLWVWLAHGQEVGVDTGEAEGGDTRGCMEHSVWVLQGGAVHRNNHN